MQGGFLTGELLIAMPAISDPRFDRALILVCAHDVQHAMGIALNRPIEGLTLPDLFDRLEVKSEIRLPPELVRVGGPVERERGFVLHTDDYVGEVSLDVTEGIRLTATREVLEAMASRDRRPRRSLLALGYAGWGPGQLEEEIRQNVWLTCEADEALIFDDAYEHEAWNHSSEVRVVLFVDFVKPLRFPANLLNWLILHLAVFTPFIREGYVAQKQWEKLFFGSGAKM